MSSIANKTEPNTTRPRPDVATGDGDECDANGGGGVCTNNWYNIGVTRCLNSAENNIHDFHAATLTIDFETCGKQSPMRLKTALGTMASNDDDGDSDDDGASDGGADDCGGDDAIYEQVGKRVVEHFSHRNMCIRTSGRAHCYTFSAPQYMHLLRLSIPVRQKRAPRLLIGTMASKAAKCKSNTRQGDN